MNQSLNSVRSDEVVDVTRSRNLFGNIDNAILRSNLPNLTEEPFPLATIFLIEPRRNLHRPICNIRSHADDIFGFHYVSLALAKNLFHNVSSRISITILQVGNAFWSSATPASVTTSFGHLKHKKEETM